MLRQLSATHQGLAQPPTHGASATYRLKASSCPHRPAVACRVASARLAPAVVNPKRLQDDAYDVVLSSGFLAFAHHSGFLQAVEEAGLRIGGIMGTSAGALAGSLYAAGYSPRQVSAHLSRDTPISLLRPSLQPWNGGVLSLEGVVERLYELLPPRFEDLEREFAVGVVDASGQHALINHGPLPEAVAASAAIPFIFSNVEVPGTSYGPLKDGGCVDRVGLRAWRQYRRAQLGPNRRPPPALVHVIERSSPFSGNDDTNGASEGDFHVVHSPKSGVSFFDLGSYQEHFEAARQRARPMLMRVRASRRPRVVAAAGMPDLPKQAPPAHR